MFKAAAPFLSETSADPLGPASGIRLCSHCHTVTVLCAHTHDSQLTTHNLLRGQTRGDTGKAYRQPTFGEPCKPTTTKTNLDAEITKPSGLGPGWARFVKGLGAVQTRGDAGKAYRQPTFGEPCKPTTTKTNLDAEIARPSGLGPGWARFVKGLGAVQTRGDAGKAYRQRRQPTANLVNCKPTTTKTNLDAETARPGGLGEVCQRPGRCSTFVLSPSV